MSALGEVKLIIKSLVSSAVDCRLTLNELNHDYKLSEGCPVPYATFGYKSLYDFLKSIEDVVHVVGYGLDATVVPCMQGKNQHIMDLNKGNKKPRNKKSKCAISFNRRDMPRTMSKVYPMIYENHPRNVPNKQFNRSPTAARRNAPSNIKPSFRTDSFSEKCKQNVPITTHSITSTTRSQTQNANLVQTVEVELNSDVSRGKESWQNDVSHSAHCDDTKKNSLPTEIVPKSSKDEKQQNYHHQMEKNQNDFNGTKSKEIVLDELQSALPKITMRTRMSSIGEKVLESMREVEAIPPGTIDDRVDSIDFPVDTVRRGQKIPSCTLPSSVRIGDRLEIIISQVHSPYKFWFRFCQRAHILDELMNSMEFYYTALDDDLFCIPQSCLVPGQICAALFKGHWHRAEILSHVHNGVVNMLYIDYGTVAHAYAHNIKYLKKTFAFIPCQALRGCLSHIKPKGLNWSMKATECFLSLVSDVPIYAEISDIDTENRVCYFILCNVMNDEIININKRMVQEGYALYDKGWLTSSENCQRVKHRRENCPTFFMLESGEYPSLTLLTEMLKTGIDYEIIINRSLFAPYILNTDESVPEYLRSLPFNLLPSNPFCSDILSTGK